MRVPVLFALLLAVALTACNSGSDKGGTSGVAREPKDPRTVPTATLPAQIPTAIPALEVSQAQRRSGQLPDVYVVKAGDTPSAIAQALGVDANELLRANGLSEGSGLRVGQQLRVPRPGQPSPTSTRPAGTTATATATARSTGTPGPGTPTRAASPTPAGAAGAGGTYTVQPGDTACGIAARLNVPLTALAEANGTTVQGLSSLSVGQSLKVPATRGPAGC